MRIVPGLKWALLFAVTVPAHRHLGGHSIDYLGLGGAAAASWFGVPGPGEPVLIAAGIIAAKHHLYITTVILVAWLGAAAGGVAGWVIGWKSGRTVLSTRGPLLRLRRMALERGDRLFTRAPKLGVLLAPSWIAGIHHAPGSVFLSINTISALVWAGGIGLGAYYAGPPVVEFVNDFHWVLGGLAAALVIAVAGIEFRRRRRRGVTDPSATSRPS